MTLINRTPTRVALSLLLLLSLLSSITPAQRRRAAKPADKKQSAKKQTAKSAKNTRARPFFARQICARLALSTRALVGPRERDCPQQARR